MAEKEGQFKYLAVGLGLLAQFGTLAVWYGELKTEVRNFVAEQERRRPLVDRFIAMETKFTDLERRMESVERTINWQRRRTSNEN